SEVELSRLPRIQDEIARSDTDAPAHDIEACPKALHRSVFGRQNYRVGFVDQSGGLRDSSAGKKHTGVVIDCWLASRRSHCGSCLITVSQPVGCRGNRMPAPASWLPSKNIISLANGHAPRARCFATYVRHASATRARLAVSSCLKAARR